MLFDDRFKFMSEKTIHEFIANKLPPKNGVCEYWFYVELVESTDLDSIVPIYSTHSVKIPKRARFLRISKGFDWWNQPAERCATI